MNCTEIQNGEILYIDVQSASGLSLQSLDFANVEVSATNNKMDVGTTSTSNLMTPTSRNGYCLDSEVVEDPTLVWDDFGAMAQQTEILDVSSYRFIRLTAIGDACITPYLSCDVPANPTMSSVPPKIDTEIVLVEDRGTNNFFRLVPQYDDTGAFVQDIYLDMLGNPANPTDPVPVNNEDYEVVDVCVQASVDGTGYSLGDKAVLFTIMSTSPVGIIGSFILLASGTQIATPNADFVACGSADREVVGDDYIALTDNPITLTKPAGANHAEISVHKTRSVITLGGTTPDFATGVGHLLNDGATFELESVSEIDAVQIAAETGGTGFIYVVYYEVPKTGYLNS